jgi:hypothetical protein
VDLSKFGFITGVTVSYIRADTPPGIKKAADFPYLSFNAEHDLYRLQARATGQFAASDPYEPRAMLPCDSLQLQLVDDTWH